MYSLGEARGPADTVLTRAATGCILAAMHPIAGGSANVKRERATVTEYSILPCTVLWQFLCQGNKTHHYPPAAGGLHWKKIIGHFPAFGLLNKTRWKVKFENAPNWNKVNMLSSACLEPAKDKAEENMEENVVGSGRMNDSLAACDIIMGAVLPSLVESPELRIFLGGNDVWLPARGTMCQWPCVKK